MKLRRSIVFVSLLLASTGLLAATTTTAFADVFFDPPPPKDASTPDDAGPGNVAPTAPTTTSPSEGLDASASAAPTPPTVIYPAPSGDEDGGDASASSFTVIAMRPMTPAVDDAGAAPTVSDAGTEYTGVSIGIRGGIGFPVGYGKSSQLSDVVSYVAPIGLDVGYYWRPNVYFGGYILYGFDGTSSSSNDACASGTDNSCSAQSYKFGLVAEYAFRHKRTMSPWVRYGIGFDVTNLTATDSSGTTQQSANLFGLDWAILSGGLDFKPGYFYGIGPYAELAFGDYTTKSGFADPHFFASLGLRGRSGLFIP